MRWGGMKDVAERSSETEQTFIRILADAVAAVEAKAIPYLLIGGLASSIHGRSRWTGDVDLFVKEDDARRVLEVLESKGFSTEEANPFWIFKGHRDGVVLDVIFRTKGDLRLDEEMIARGMQAEVMGIPVRVISPEDLIVMKALVHDEEVPHQWHDALGILAASDLDWDYLLRRARLGQRRVLSLLVYAQSSDLLVPDEVIRKLYGRIYEGLPDE